MMSPAVNLKSFFQEHKTLLVVILVGLFLIELEIFALAVTKSGRKSWLAVMDDSGQVIYETDGQNLSQFDKYYFEKTFGPFENYQVKLRTEQRPFPFRAWFVAAVGLPVGLMLVFGFVVKAYVAIFHEPGQPASEPVPPERESASRLEAVLDRISRLNIFAIGFLILVAVVGYWVIPNLITYLGHAGLETLIRYKWFFLGGVAVVVGIGVWIIYLRYLLAKKSIESQTEIEKLKLQLGYDKGLRAPRMIAAEAEQAARRPPSDPVVDKASNAHPDN